MSVKAWMISTSDEIVASKCVKPRKKVLKDLGFFHAVKCSQPVTTIKHRFSGNFRGCIYNSSNPEIVSSLNTLL